jgi:uncharacterized protein YdaU (DUF1376 family)
VNFYQRHLGDYAKDTKHLTMIEHGAYCLLLDYYYATEKPIPADRCERIANAYADAEREAVKSVLKEFFTETAEGWRHFKCDDVIEDANSKSLKAKESAKSRWMRTQCERNANVEESQCDGNPIHKPLTNNHKREGGASAPVIFHGVSEKVVADFKALRKAKKAPITETAIDGIGREASKAGLTLEAALKICCERGWTGFKSEWVLGQQAPTGPRPPRRREL